MSSQASSFLDYGIGEDTNPKKKLNSLISVTVSTVMCLASKCPLPKSNVETTKMFLRTITDDDGNIPRNIKNFLSLLNNYSGPFEIDSHPMKNFDKSPAKKPAKEKDKKVLEDQEKSKISVNTMVLREESTVLTRRSPKSSAKRVDKELKKSSRNLVSNTSSSKYTINKS